MSTTQLNLSNGYDNLSNGTMDTKSCPSGAQLTLAVKAKKQMCRERDILPSFPADKGKSDRSAHGCNSCQERLLQP